MQCDPNLKDTCFGPLSFPSDKLVLEKPLLIWILFAGLSVLKCKQVESKSNGSNYVWKVFFLIYYEIKS